MARGNNASLKKLGYGVKGDLERILDSRIPDCEFKYGSRKDVLRNYDKIQRDMYGPLREKLKGRNDGFLFCDPEDTSLFYDAYNKTVYLMPQDKYMSINKLKSCLAHELGHHLLATSIPEYHGKEAELFQKEGEARLEGRKDESRKYHDLLRDMMHSEEGFADWCSLNYSKEKLPKQSYSEVAKTTIERAIYPGNNIQEFISFDDENCEDAAEAKLKSRNEAFEVVRELAGTKPETK